LWYDKLDDCGYDLCYYDRVRDADEYTKTIPEARCPGWQCLYCFEDFLAGIDHTDCGMPAGEWLGNLEGKNGK